MDCPSAPLSQLAQASLDALPDHLGSALLQYCQRQYPPETPCIWHVDKVRRLIGVALFANPSPTPQFSINGTPCRPVFLRHSTWTCPSSRRIDVTIFWFAYDTDFIVFEARQEAIPLAMLYQGALLPRLESRHLAAPPKPARSLLQRCVAFLARLPLIRRYFSGCWLLIDRDFKADDNAEHLYRWIMLNHPEQKIFFALRRDSPDWPRLRKEGFRLLNSSGLTYAFAWLHCSWLISSNATGHIRPREWRIRYADITHHQFCFLQHGIIKDYLPNANRFLADLFITTVRREYRSIAEDERYPYIYSAREVRLTGLPRHDALLRKASAVQQPKRILIMPTWRKNLLDSLMPGAGQYPYAAGFSQSDFFQQWQKVLQSNSLWATTRQQGYEVCFFPHPHLRQQVGDFQLDGVTVLPDTGGSLQDILADTALLITDYSSIAMEMALLRRPVLYFQFDRAAFFSHAHNYGQGYFDYEQDGFGEVAGNPERLSSLIKQYVKKGCGMKAAYRKRADSFFSFQDQNNCLRVYEALCEYSLPLCPERLP